MTTLDASYESAGSERHTESTGRGWLLGLGVAQVALGMLAISSTFVVSVASAFVFGVSLIVGGVLQLLHAISDRRFAGFAWHVALGILYTIAGASFMLNPLGALFPLTFALAFYFWVGGVMRLALAFQLRKFAHFGWMALAGATNLVLGALIWSGWPSSALWVIGTLIGVDLLMHGWSLVMLALAGGKLQEQ